MSQRRTGVWLLLVLLVAVPLLLWLFAAHQRDIAGYALKTLWSADQRSQQAHVGELVAGREITQPLDWSGLQALSVERFGTAELCVALYFANYFDRRNRGQLAVELAFAESAGGAADAPIHAETSESWRTRAETRLDMAAIRNYRFEPVCFDGVTLAEAVEHAARLQVRGVDGVRGSSVTLYLAVLEDPLAPAVVDGELVDRSLIHRVQVLAEHGNEQRAAWLILVFVVAVLLVVALAVAPTLQQAPRRDRSGGLMG